jgi:ubiquinone/menaquinone biosynthesis C-methylase UbiE
MRNSIDGENEFGEEYFSALSDNAYWHSRIQEEHELTMRLLSPKSGERVLDIGCGKGRIEQFLTGRVPGIEVVSSDVTPEAKKYIKGTFVQCSMTALPFPDESFDAVLCLHVIAHFKDGEQGIKEAFRVLKKGGALMIVTPNKYYVRISWLIAFLKRSRIKYDSTAQWLYSKSTLRELLLQSSWRSIKFSYLQRAPRVLPFEMLRAKLVVVATK